MALPFTAPFAACDLVTVIGASTVSAAPVGAVGTRTAAVSAHVNRAPSDSVLYDAQDGTVESPVVVTSMGLAAPQFVPAIYRTIGFRNPPVTLRL